MSNLTNEEKLVLTTLLQQAIDGGFQVDVDDEEGYYLIEQSRDVEAILDVMGDTEQESIYISTPNGGPIGWIDIFYCDGAEEMIADYTDRTSIIGIVEAAHNALAQYRANTAHTLYSPNTN